MECAPTFGTCRKGDLHTNAYGTFRDCIFDCTLLGVVCRRIGGKFIAVGKSGGSYVVAVADRRTVAECFPIIICTNAVVGVVAYELQSFPTGFTIKICNDTTGLDYFCNAIKVCDNIGKCHTAGCFKQLVDIDKCGN